MFKRGDVVRQTDTGWIGVVEYMEQIQVQDGATNYGKVIWFEGRNPPSSGGYHFTLAAHPFIEKIDGYAFEAALALGDTAKALELYRAAQAEQSKQEQQAEAKARRLQAGINVIGQYLANSTDEVVRELTGEKPYFMPGIITAVQFLVDAHTKLQAALEPFAAYGRLKHSYAPEAVFTLAYDRNGQAVTLLFSDFTHAAQLLPNAQARTTEATTGSAGGIALIAEGNA